MLEYFESVTILTQLLKTRCYKRIRQTFSSSFLSQGEAETETSIALSLCDRKLSHKEFVFRLQQEKLDGNKARNNSFPKYIWRLFQIESCCSSFHEIISVPLHA